MPQTLADIFGQSVTSDGDTVTINLADFKDDSGNQILDKPNEATDSQKIAAIAAGMVNNAKPQKDADGQDVIDKTSVIVAEESFSPKTFEVRQDEAQVKHEFIFSIYTIDSTKFDPDNAV